MWASVRFGKVSIRFGKVRVGHTNGILEVFLTNQSHILFYGFSGERVLAKDKVLPFHEPVYLRHGHV